MTVGAREERAQTPEGRAQSLRRLLTDADLALQQLGHCRHGRGHPRVEPGKGLVLVECRACPQSDSLCNVPRGLVQALVDYVRKDFVDARGQKGPGGTPWGRILDDARDFNTYQLFLEAEKRAVLKEAFAATNKWNPQQAEDSIRKVVARVRRNLRADPKRYQDEAAYYSPWSLGLRVGSHFAPEWVTRFEARPKNTARKGKVKASEK